MPSENQFGTDERPWPDLETKLVATKDQTTLWAIIKGLDDREEILRYAEAEIALADDQDRDVRKWVVALANRRISILNGLEENQ